MTASARTPPPRIPPPRMSAAEYREFVGVAAPAPAAPERKAQPELDAVHNPFAAYLAVALPQGERGCWWTHFPAGEWRSKKGAARLKAMGTLPGVADFLLVKWGFLFALEAKAPNGRFSDAQRAFRRLCMTSGVAYELMFEPDEGEAFLRRHGFPLLLTWPEFETRAPVGRRP